MIILLFHLVGGSSKHIGMYHQRGHWRSHTTAGLIYLLLVPEIRPRACSAHALPIEQYPSAASHE